MVLYIINKVHEIYLMLCTKSIQLEKSIEYYYRIYQNIIIEQYHQRNKSFVLLIDVAAKNKAYFLYE